MFIFDADKYHRLPNHGLTCIGDDAVSRTMKTGCYENFETMTFLNILAQNKEGVVLDFGSHIGWYSIIAAKAGREVIAFECNQEKIDILYENAKLNDTYIKAAHNMWIDETTDDLYFNKDILLLKCDLEGAEKHVIRMCKTDLEANKIKYLLLEISPCINDSYPKLMKYLYSLGYLAVDVCNVKKGIIKEEDIDSWLDSIKQENLLFFKDEK